MIQNPLFIAATALLVEAVTGYPAIIYQFIGHPVSWFGTLIAMLEKRFNRPSWSQLSRKISGILTLLGILAIVGGTTVFIERALFGVPFGVIAIVILAATLPAQKSLYGHVVAVATALEISGLHGGQKAVSMIVGRNPLMLDEAGVSRAAIESLAENFSDGVVAPIFWTAVLGLPGGALYKAINTADSMIGHKTERYQAFGWASARLDDLVNLPASRLAALWIILAAFFVSDASPLEAIRAVRRDASHHRSPNAGWPEAAMAGALGFALAGPRVYGETMVDDVYMGNGRLDLTAADIRQSLNLYRVACVIEGAAVVGLVFYVTWLA